MALPAARAVRSYACRHYARWPVSATIPNAAGALAQSKTIGSKPSSINHQLLTMNYIPKKIPQPLAMNH